MSSDTALAAEPPTPAQVASFTYDAFLSYNHQDEAVAAGIHKGLHRIGRRMGRLNALRVFRDTTEMAANTDLWGKVTDAMDRSRYLIVVLSPRAAASEWVNKEVAHWLKGRGPEQLLIVVAEGHLDWDEATGRFDPDRSDAALPVLTEPKVLPTEPLYVDVSGDAPWDAQTPAFRDKVTDLAAPIHGKSKYELASNDVREQRRFRRLRRGAIGALIILTVMAITAAAFATVQWRSAIRQRNQAMALILTSQAQSMLAGNEGGGDVRALQQILAAPRISADADTGALFTGVVARRDTVKIIPTGRSVIGFALSPDGKRIVTGSDDGTIRIWDASTGAPVTEPLAGHKKMVDSVAYSLDGKRIVSSVPTTGRCGYGMPPPANRSVSR